MLLLIIKNIKVNMRATTNNRTRLLGQSPAHAQTHAQSESMCTVKLSGGLGNWLFITLAGLSYAKKNGKKFVLVSAYAQNAQHGTTLDYIKRIFPDITIVPSFTEKVIVLKESIQFQYAPLKQVPSNVILQGFFQNPKYIENINIPSIKTTYYPDTYFIHIRAGDYINNPILDVGLTEYYRKCFDLCKNRNIKYIVASDDNDYAKNYLQQFNINFEISNKIDPVDCLIEMANCAGGICANSTFSWFGAFFQIQNSEPDQKHEIFMPAKWIKNKNCSGIYPPWATII
jgi:hypothetical protein